MEKGLRRKYLVMLADKFKACPTFKQTRIEMVGQTFPSGIIMPAAFISRSTEQLGYETDTTVLNHMFVDVILAVQAAQDVDLVKSDATDAAEELVMSMLLDSAVRSFVTLVTVVAVDASPTALFEFGMQQAILPPFGVVRMKTQVDFSYKFR